MNTGQTHTGDSATWPHYVLVFVLSWVAWMLLAGELATAEAVTGAVAALVVTLSSGQHLAVYTGVRFSWMAVVHLPAFLFVFLRALVFANIDMARRVLSPALPIRPEIVQVETCLQSPLGKLLLTSAITLTPGTLAVDVQGNQLSVHWVYCPPGLDMGARTAAIVSEFERHLSGFLK